ncbi:MAG TPA: helix-turn-helix transcriptional regulator [Candidatus Tumulicola sp.]
MDFVSAAIHENDPDLVFLCRALADDRIPESKDGLLRDIQIEYRTGNFSVAFTKLRQFLDARGLNTGRWEPDRGAFQVLRRAKVTQGALASAIGVSQSAVSQFEKGRTTLSLARLLLAAAFFEVQPNAIIITLRGKANQAEVVRIDVRGASSLKS